MPLPTVKRPAVSKSPRKLVLIGLPKHGKTTALSLLDDALILDFEKGSAFLDALTVDVVGLVAPRGDKTAPERHDKGQYYLNEIVAEVKSGNYNYKYLVVDTCTKMEDYCKQYALQLYKASPIGKNFDGDDVLTLPKGAGYMWLRKAFDYATDLIESTGLRIIYVCHVKTSAIEKDGKELQETDIDLTGKLKTELATSSDAIGFFERRNDKCVISFKTTNELKVGARPDHLKNKAFYITEQDESGNIVAHWNKIYID